MPLDNALDTNVLSLEGLKQHLLSQIHRHATYSASKDRATIWLNVTPELAAALLKYMMYSTQRKLVSKRISVLLDAVVDGSLLNNNLIWTCVTKKDQWVIINSQHTLQAIIQSGKSVELQLVLDNVGTMADVAKRYACFDIGGLRTQVDIVDAADMHENGTLKHDESWYVVPPAKAVASINTLRNSFTNGTARGSDKIANLRIFQDNWIKEFEFLNQYLRPLSIDLTPHENRASAVINNQMKAMRHTLQLPTIIAIFLLALKSHPRETEMLLNALVDRARSVVEYDGSSVETLFMYLNAPKSIDVLDTKRRGMVTANIVRCIVAYRETDDITVDQLYVEPSEMKDNERATLWETLSDGEVPRMEVIKTKVDRKKIIRGVFGKAKV